MGKVFLSLLVLFSLINPISINAQGVSSKGAATLGVTLSEEQRQETINILGANEVSKESIITIDGTTVNQFLKDGSDNSTDIYSSAYVEMKSEGYGVQVQIVTPDNIQSVNKTTYQSAAITAGAQNALIKIASVVPVTGEGALTGVYKAFESAGIALNEEAIKVAESQLSVEQQLNSLSGLTSEEISIILNTLNVEIIKYIGSGEDVSDQGIRDLVLEITAEYKLSSDALDLLVNHGLRYAASPAAQDRRTQEIIMISTEESIIGKQYSHGGISVTIDDIYFTEERDNYASGDFDNVLTIEYTLQNKGDEDHYTGNELQLYVDNHQGEQYFLPNFKSGAVSPGRTTSVIVSFGFNGETSNIELEFKDFMAWDDAAVTIEVSNIRSEIEGDASETIEVENSSILDQPAGAYDIESIRTKEIKEGLLTEVGQFIFDDYSGIVTLLNIVHPEVQAVIAEGITVTVHTVKLLNLSDIPSESVADLQMELGIGSEGGQYIQYEYTVENNNDFKIMNPYFTKAIYSNNEQINSNVISSSEAFDLSPKAKVVNVVGFMGSPEEQISWVELYMEYLTNDQTLQSLENNGIQIDFTEN